MIIKDNFKDLLAKLGFSSKGDTFTKKFKETDAYLKVDFKTEKLIYPEDKGFTINERQTCNFKQKENFVVFECVHRLFDQQYKPEHIELEPKWKVGHGASGGRADIMVKDNSGKSLLIIECKTEGKEFDDAWKKTLINGGQLLSYVKQAGSTQFVCLYASDYLDNKVLAEVNLSKSETRSFNESTLVSFVEMASVSEEGFISHREDRLLKDVKTGSYCYFKEGDIIIAKITPCMENGKCAIATGLTNEIGFGSSEFHVFRANKKLTNNKFLFAFINRKVIREEAEKNMTGSSGHRRVPDTFYKNLQIPTPTDLKVQTKLISNIENAETKIKTSQELIDGIAKKKEEVIKSYLIGKASEPKLAMAAEPKEEYKKK